MGCMEHLAFAIRFLKIEKCQGMIPQCSIYVLIYNWLTICGDFAKRVVEGDFGLFDRRILAVPQGIAK
jgi:hypothetical protein